MLNIGHSAWNSKFHTLKKTEEKTIQILIDGVILIENVHQFLTSMSPYHFIVFIVISMVLLSMGGHSTKYDLIICFDLIHIGHKTQSIKPHL